MDWDFNRSSATEFSAVLERLAATHALPPGEQTEAVRAIVEEQGATVRGLLAKMSLALHALGIAL